MRGTPLTLVVAAGGKASSDFAAVTSIYQDGGDGYDHMKGEYETRLVKAQGMSVTILSHTEPPTYEPPQRLAYVEFVGVEKMPKEIRPNVPLGETTFDPATRR